MSKCTPKDTAFINDCERTTYKILTAWADKIKCYYDGSPYCTKRDYVLSASHCFGSAYCNWKYRKQELFEALRAIGATNIIGRVEWNFVDVAFDIKKSRLKSDGLIQK